MARPSKSIGEAEKNPRCKTWDTNRHLILITMSFENTRGADATALGPMTSNPLYLGPRPWQRISIQAAICQEGIRIMNID